MRNCYIHRNLAIGNIIKDKTSLNYIIKSYNQDTYFSINFFDEETSENFLIFVLPSEPSLELIRIWKLNQDAHNLSTNFKKLSSWLLTCANFTNVNEFQIDQSERIQNLLNVSSDESSQDRLRSIAFNQILFNNLCQQEIFVILTNSAILIQSTCNGYVLRCQLYKILFKPKYINNSIYLSKLILNRRRNNLIRLYILYSHHISRKKLHSPKYSPNKHFSRKNTMKLKSNQAALIDTPVAVVHTSAPTVPRIYNNSTHYPLHISKIMNSNNNNSKSANGIPVSSSFKYKNTSTARSTNNSALNVATNSKNTPHDSDNNTISPPKNNNTNVNNPEDHVHSSSNRNQGDADADGHTGEDRDEYEYLYGYGEAGEDPDHREDGKAEAGGDAAAAYLATFLNTHHPRPQSSTPLTARARRVEYVPTPPLSTRRRSSHKLFDVSHHSSGTLDSNADSDLDTEIRQRDEHYRAEIMKKIEDNILDFDTQNYMDTILNIRRRNYVNKRKSSSSNSLKMYQTKSSSHSHGGRRAQKDHKDTAALKSISQPVAKASTTAAATAAAAVSTKVSGVKSSDDLPIDTSDPTREAAGGDGSGDAAPSPSAYPHPYPPPSPTSPLKRSLKKHPAAITAAATTAAATTTATTTAPVLQASIAEESQPQPQVQTQTQTQQSHGALVSRTISRTFSRTISRAISRTISKALTISPPDSRESSTNNLPIQRMPSIDASYVSNYSTADISRLFSSDKLAMTSQYILHSDFRLQTPIKPRKRSALTCSKVLPPASMMMTSHSYYLQQRSFILQMIQQQQQQQRNAATFPYFPSASTVSFSGRKNVSLQIDTNISTTVQNASGGSTGTAAYELQYERLLAQTMELSLRRDALRFSQYSKWSKENIDCWDDIRYLTAIIDHSEATEDFDRCILYSMKVNISNLAIQTLLRMNSLLLGECHSTNSHNDIFHYYNYGTTALGSIVDLLVYFEEDVEVVAVGLDYLDTLLHYAYSKSIVTVKHLDTIAIFIQAGIMDVIKSAIGNKLLKNNSVVKLLKILSDLTSSSEDLNILCSSSSYCVHFTRIFTFYIRDNDVINHCCHLLVVFCRGNISILSKLHDYKFFGMIPTVLQLHVSNTYVISSLCIFIGVLFVQLHTRIKSFVRFKEVCKQLVLTLREFSQMDLAVPVAGAVPVIPPSTPSNNSTRKDTSKIDRVGSGDSDTMEKILYALLAMTVGGYSQSCVLIGWLADFGFYDDIFQILSNRSIGAHIAGSEASSFLCVLLIIGVWNEGRDTVLLKTGGDMKASFRSVFCKLHEQIKNSSTESSLVDSGGRKRVGSSDANDYSIFSPSFHPFGGRVADIQKKSSISRDMLLSQLEVAINCTYK